MPLTKIVLREEMNSTILLKHWAGRNSRGVTQFEGAVIHELIINPKDTIDKAEAEKFLQNLINL